MNIKISVLALAWVLSGTRELQAFSIPSRCEQQSVAELLFPRKITGDDFESFLQREIPARAESYLQEWRALPVESVSYSRGHAKLKIAGRLFKLKLKVPARLNEDNRWTWEFAFLTALHLHKSSALIEKFENDQMSADSLGAALHESDEHYLALLRQINPEADSFFSASVVPNNTPHRIVLCLGSWLSFFHPFRYRMKYQHELTVPPLDAGVVSLRAWGLHQVRTSRRLSYALSIFLAATMLWHVDWHFVQQSLWGQEPHPQAIEMKVKVEDIIVKQQEEIAARVHAKLIEEYRLKREALVEKMSDAKKNAPTKVPQLQQELRELDDEISFVFQP